VLLAPVLFSVMRQTGMSVMRLGSPLVAGLSAAHGHVPPHPGPVSAIERLGADTGRTLFYSLIVSFPVALISGPFIGRLAGRRMHVAPGPIAEQFAAQRASTRVPSLPITLLTILAPVMLMLLAALAQSALADGVARRWIVFAGSPLMAMLLATLLAMFTFGRACGFDRSQVLRFAEDSLPPIAGVLLVVGAGGGFGRVLVSAGVDHAIAQVASGFHMSPLVLGWVIAALLRLAVGSATVSVVTSASIMAPMIATMPGVNRELLVVSIGAGSLIASHVNDGGFWLVKEYLNLTVQETLATWTVLETVVSLTGLVGVLMLSQVVG
jgi:GntP family gluconate:H+ symporter